ncbi:SOUL family heme-binding protein [Sediminicoccus sp. BL-A-41-H5]|uniref:SOUL family heme-binding protein n=1 Tax=Sediminicoccus sp. BL-A-41-H5 TaxID=3421106 RepID=UPI003D67BAE1
MRRRLLPLLLAPFVAACSAFGMRDGTEEPPFTVIARVGELEIRRYAPRLIAEISVTGDEVSARSAAFRPLAAYIFGENDAAERIGMTAPVAQGRAEAGERIGMTAPVAQSGGEGQWRVGFFMPARYSLATLPRPRDPRIAIVTLPEVEVAVLRFSGLPGAEAVAAAQARLDAALAGSAWTPSGPGGAWFYDPPWTIPALRRSEAWRPVLSR